MREAALFGCDHTELGALAAVAEGPAAITICRGGAAKTYSYADPNEDAALFVVTEHAVLLAVADGHDGHQGARAAIETLRDTCARDWCGASGPANAIEWQRAAARAVAHANHAVLAEAGARGTPPAPTTLAFALWRRAAAQVHGASVGDSHVFFSGATETLDLERNVTRAEKRGRFLGRGAIEDADAAGMTTCETTPAADVLALVLATDGLSERGIGVEDPPTEVHRAREHAWAADDEIRPLAIAKAVSAVALGAHRRQRAGDNIACAVALIGD